MVLLCSKITANLSNPIPVSTCFLLSKVSDPSLNNVEMSIKTKIHNSALADDLDLLNLYQVFLRFPHRLLGLYECSE